MARRQSISNPKSLTLSLIFLSLTFLLLTHTFRPKPYSITHLQNNSFHLALKNHPWYDVVAKEINSEKINIGLVNMDERDIGELDAVMVSFDRIAEDLKWEHFFPEWIDEDEKFGQPKCPEMPMPQLANYERFDVVVARVPCERNGTEREDVRDLFRLQVNLVVGNVLVRSGWKNNRVDRTVYVVFKGSCGPMWEMFRCDDLLWHEGEYWVYRPDLIRLKQIMAMPVGTCQLVPPISKPGEEDGNNVYQAREAYVTVLHSSEAYVCGAIALAQSIIQTNSTKDLILLADHSISPNSLQALQSSGWNTKLIQRIPSPHAKPGAYNQYNYSKLRIWQLTRYHKLIFIDSDLVVLKNMDHFFNYPQLSAVRNDKFRFNSGVMLVEPSTCMFKTLMEKRFQLGSYNGGDQGFLNEVFTWWHRWPGKLNHLKISVDPKLGGSVDRKHDVDVYAIHYLGLKPWMCYEDYDCNWDMLDHHVYASDSAHRKWWGVYKGMPEKLREYCGLSQLAEERIRKWRRRAKIGGLADGHWRMKVKDPRSRQVRLSTKNPMH